MIFYLLLLCLIGVGTNIYAEENVPITVDRAGLFVTHASRIFDEKESIRPGLERALAEAERSKTQTIFVTQRELTEHPDWIGENHSPDISYISSNGAHDMIVTHPEQTFAGGFLSLCQDRTVTSGIESYFGHNDGKIFEATVLMDATYEDKFLFGAPIGKKQMDWYFSVDSPLNLQIFYEKLGKVHFTKGLVQLLEIMSLPYSVELWVKGEKVHTLEGEERKVIYKFE